ncbi:MAG: hypothetical protein GX941_05580 [Candidatus Methanofastidiosa archaeon]|nr:hypothetical protein [Candidatus Methanofastidiosa archaeon]
MISLAGRMMMRIDSTSPNPALVSIFSRPDQTITLDANILIPPDRSRYAKRSFDFPLFRKIWLEPIFTAFSNLAIHEAVYDELVLTPLRCYIQSMIDNIPSRLNIHKDSDLTAEEKVLRDFIEAKIFPLTNYDPLFDNKDDRGEVKSLAYIAVKGLLYFAAHDTNAVQLVEKAEEWSTGLDNVQAIKMHELIYYLYKTNIGDKKSLRMLYKYQYYLTQHEKKTNPEWSQFIEEMDALYL